MERHSLERDEIRLGHDDGAFFFSRPDAAQQEECCEPAFTLLCMGLFSRFFVQALPCAAEGTVCRVRDTLLLDAVGISQTCHSRSRPVPSDLASPVQMPRALW